MTEPEVIVDDLLLYADVTDDKMLIAYADGAAVVQIAALMADARDMGLEVSDQYYDIDWWRTVIIMEKPDEA